MLSITRFPKSQSLPLMNLDTEKLKRENSGASSEASFVAELLLRFSADGVLIDDDTNRQIIADIKNYLSARCVDADCKRQVFENAINCGYKKYLNQLMDELRQADRQIILEGVDLSELDLSGLDLSGANAVRTNFRRAILSQANLTRATLAQADLSGANAQGALFESALFDATLVNGFKTDNPVLAVSYALVP